MAHRNRWFTVLKHGDFPLRTVEKPDGIKRWWLYILYFLLYNSIYLTWVAFQFFQGIVVDPVLILGISDEKLAQVQVYQGGVRVEEIAGNLSSQMQPMGSHGAGICTHTRPGKRLHNYGKIHHFQWVNPLFRLGHSNSYVKLPEGTFTQKYLAQFCRCADSMGCIWGWDGLIGVPSRSRFYRFRMID